MGKVEKLSFDKRGSKKTGEILAPTTAGNDFKIGGSLNGETIKSIKLKTQ
jgi:hypothetical protein